MTVAAARRLDDQVLLASGDPGGMLRHVASAAAQVRTAVRAAAEVDLGSLATAARPRAIVVTGMDAGGLAGEALAAVCGPGCATQVSTVRDYRLPGWVGAADLVIAVSGSGATEETLAVGAEAARRGCPVVAVGAAGSPLEQLAGQARAPFVPVELAGVPRATLWGLAIPLLVIADRLGIIEIGVEEYESAASELERLSYLCRPDSDAFVNPAKALALELAGTLPVIWGTSPLAGVAARRLASQLQQNAKYPAVGGTLPESAHNQAATFDGPFAPWPPVPIEQDQPALPLRLVVLRDNQEHPQVARRREAAVELAGRRGIEVSQVDAEGERPLDRLATMIGPADYASVYLGIAIGVDPLPVTAIAELRDRIT